jgi:hypothetical protein
VELEKSGKEGDVPKPVSVPADGVKIKQDNVEVQNRWGWKTHEGKATNSIIIYLLSVYTMSPGKAGKQTKNVPNYHYHHSHRCCHPQSSREHMFEEQARYIPSCAMMKVEKQANGLAPQTTSENKLTEK